MVAEHYGEGSVKTRYKIKAINAVKHADSHN